MPITRWTSVGRRSKVQRVKLDSRSLVETGSDMCQARSDMFQGGEKNALELSGLAAASAGGRRLRGSFLHLDCLHHANWMDQADQ